jgi:hypothetical protein
MDASSLVEFSLRAGNHERTRDRAGRHGIRPAFEPGLLSAETDLKCSRFDQAFPTVIDDRKLFGRDSERDSLSFA